MATKTKVQSIGSKRRSAPARLAEGLHAAKIELKGEGRFHVRTLDGARHVALLGDDFEPALADECLRTGKAVIICNTERGPVILGALQTSRAFERDASGVARFDADEIRLRAARAIVLQSGSVSLRLDQRGVVRVEGKKMVIDMSSLLHVLAAMVELP